MITYDDNKLDIKHSIFYYFPVLNMISYQASSLISRKVMLLLRAIQKFNN